MVEQVCKFLGKHYTDAQIDGLLEHLSFMKMRQNPAINLEPILEQMFEPVERKTSDNKFIRKGQVGDWRNYLSEDMAMEFDKLNEEQWTEIGLNFEY